MAKTRRPVAGTSHSRVTCVRYSMATGVVSLASLLAVGWCLYPHQLAAQRLPEWKVDKTPIVLVGANDSPQSQFGRVVGATRLDGGAILVADAAANEVRRFEGNGEFTRVVARVGSGPGEFRSLASFVRRGDLLVAGELLSSAVTVLRSDGAFVSRDRIPTKAAVGPVTAHDRFADGQFVFSASALRMVAQVEGLKVDSLNVGMGATQGDRPPLWLPAREQRTRVVVQNPGGAKPFLSAVSHFHPQLSLVVVGADLLLGFGDSARLERMTAFGVRLPPIRLRLDGIPVNQTLARSAMKRAAQEASDEPERRLAEAMFADAAKQKKWPFYSRVLRGYEGEIWIELFRADDAAPADYLVIRPSGTAIARVKGVPPMRLLEVGRDYILGVKTTQIGAQAVGVFRLDRAH